MSNFVDDVILCHDFYKHKIDPWQFICAGIHFFLNKVTMKYFSGLNYVIEKSLYYEFEIFTLCFFHAELNI